MQQAVVSGSNAPSQHVAPEDLKGDATRAPIGVGVGPDGLGHPRRGPADRRDRRAGAGPGPGRRVGLDIGRGPRLLRGGRGAGRLVVIRSRNHPSPVVELPLLRVPSFSLPTIAMLLFTVAFLAMISRRRCGRRTSGATPRSRPAWRWHPAR